MSMNNGFRNILTAIIGHAVYDLAKNKFKGARRSEEIWKELARKLGDKGTTFENRVVENVFKRNSWFYKKYGKEGKFEFPSENVSKQWKEVKRWIYASMENVFINDLYEESFDERSRDEYIEQMDKLITLANLAEQIQKYGFPTTTKPGVASTLTSIGMELLKDMEFPLPPEFDEWYELTTKSFEELGITEEEHGKRLFDYGLKHFNSPSTLTLALFGKGVICISSGDFNEAQEIEKKLRELSPEAASEFVKLATNPNLIDDDNHMKFVNTKIQEIANSLASS